MDKVILTALQQIHNPKGNVFHAMKKSDEGFYSFGEAYFSIIHQGDIKGWKQHKKMILNLIVPEGEIQFVLYNEKNKEFFTVTLSPENYKRLTVKPGVWMAFKGIKDKNILLNLASIEHNPEEVVSLDLDRINYEW